MTKGQETMAIVLLAVIALAAIIIFVRVKISGNKYKNFKKIREENINAFKRNGFLAQAAQVAADMLAVYFDYTNKQFLVEKYNVLTYETKLDGPYSLDKLKKAAVLVDGKEYTQAGENDDERLAYTVAFELGFENEADKLVFELLNEKVLRVSGVFAKCVKSALELAGMFEEYINKNNK